MTIVAPPGAVVDLHAHAGHRGRSERFEGSGEVDADDPGDGDRGRSVGDHVRPGHGELCRSASPGRVDAETRTSEPVEDDVADAHVAGRPVGDHVGTGSRAHGDHTFVVGVEHGGPGGRECGDEFALGHGDAVEATDQLGVGMADDGDDADVGAGDLAQLADVAEPAHAHLEDQHLGVVRCVQDRDR